MPDLSATDLRAFIPARDFAVSKRFYSALGWHTADVGPGLALVEVGDAQHFYLQDYFVKEVAENSMLHVTVRSASDWHAHMLGVLQADEFAGARATAPARQPYGALVTFVHDPSGVLIHLCQWDR